MVLVIDPQIAGISGDMLLSSLVDLGADKEKVIDGIKKSEKFFSDSTINKIDFQKIKKHGIDSLQLILEIDKHSHEKKGSEIKKAINDSTQNLGLSDKARMFSESCINSLISSESKIHGVPEDTVHFHEASSIDTLVDIVGITIALDDLGLFDEKIICMPISVGGGSVTFSHGTMSNPASAILEIFKNSHLKIKGTNADEELTTPTGACILANLTNTSMDYYPSMKINSIGYGAGQKDFEKFANVLKLVRGSASNLEIDSVKILETNVDDISGEILGNLIEKIMQKDARDVSIFHGITKKGRPTNLVSVICDDQNIDEIVDTLVLETGTLGVRISESTRFVVPRTNENISLTIDGKSFDIRYKKSSFKGKIDFKIEFDDLKNISNTLGKSIKETESLLRKEIEKLEN
ncbi:MAG: nickel pincer cofactor biosynthesis protein LarC [Nitrosopumilus sp.]|nr:nickel pincer cofactor biosynthesis protein LarC [Nitrosopumilus sp.]MCE2505484.1 nickel pincer cofactor biosynthesis protein LarC [Nitrosopumilaceae archaeon]